MNILFYCQHVLGVGHFFRSIEICKALRKYSVTLVLGGPAENLPIPEGIDIVQLPCLMMDKDFSELSPCEEETSLDQIKETRKDQLISLVKSLKPDIFLIELYPFGRKAFRFELEPAIEAARDLSCSVFCSLRDILVEKKKQSKYEDRVVNILNHSFDGLLVHSDPTILPLAKTFGSIDKISIPIVYTGFVAKKELTESSISVRTRHNLAADDHLIVASAGSGAVGHNLLKAVAESVQHTKTPNLQLVIFTGPHMDEAEFEGINQYSFKYKNISVHRFTPHFMAYLSEADLSISMAGYNTCMNIMTTMTPALMWPFSQNREQRLRAELLGGPITVLNDTDLSPGKLAETIDQKLAPSEPQPVAEVNLDGAKNTAQWIESYGGSSEL